MKYLVIVDGTEGSYSAYSPDLPGCVAAGKSREHTLELMRGAMVLHLKGISEDGQPVPEPTTSAEYITVKAS